MIETLACGCMSHASHMHWSKAVREPFLYRFLAILTTLSNCTLHASYDKCIVAFQFKKMQVKLSPFLIVYLPIEFGSKIVLNGSALWHFWCHSFAWCCMHHTTMPCTCFARWCAEVIIPLILSTHHQWSFSVFYVLHLLVFGNFGLVGNRLFVLDPTRILCNLFEVALKANCRDTQS